MIKIEDYDVLKTRVSVAEQKWDEQKWDGCTRFGPTYSTADYPAGSIFLTLRRRKVTNVEFGGKSFKKEFEEIVLSPDGKVGVLEQIKRTRIA